MHNAQRYTDFHVHLTARSWLHRFKQRRGIKRKRYEGGADSAGADSAGIDSEETTSQLLSHDDNVFIANRDDTTESIADADDIACCEPVDEHITSKEARRCLSTVIAYFEQTGSSTRHTSDNANTLDFLWKLSSQMNDWALRGTT